MSGRQRVAVALLVLSVGGTALAGLALRAALLPVAAPEAPTRVEIPAGASLGRIADQLEQAGAIRSAFAFTLLARARGMGARLRSGEYEIAPLATAADVLEQLAEGRVRMHEVALPEGLTMLEIATRLGAARLAETQAFLEVARSAEVARTFGVEGDTLEGYLFPETYRLARGLPALEIARSMVEHFHAVWREIAPLAAQRGLSMRDAVTLASIVEKETGVAAERPLVASVFSNRLARGMRLETDPAVIYGIPGFDGNLRRHHLEDESNPYNTYRIPGLPPGPIANPGEASLRAVVAPAETQYLFFVSRNDGTHVFSETYREHTNAVVRFQRGGRRQRQ